jgi:hypothetical protein
MRELDKLIEKYYTAKEKALKLMTDGNIAKYFQAVLRANELEKQIEMLQQQQAA